MSCWFSLFPFSKVGTRCISRPPDLRTKIWVEILGLYTGIYGNRYCDQLFLVFIFFAFCLSVSSILQFGEKIILKCYKPAEILEKMFSDEFVVRGNFVGFVYISLPSCYWFLAGFERALLMM